MTDDIERPRAGMPFTQRTGLKTTCPATAMGHRAAIMAILVLRLSARLMVLGDRWRVSAIDRTL
jgi:hypothetical protein